MDGLLVNGSTLQEGKYKIVRHISSGGFGNTYEGLHGMMETRVAIKEFFPKSLCIREEHSSRVLFATGSNSQVLEKLRRKFKEEAMTLREMDHPNIVRVIDIFEENGTAYYAMEYIDGRSLGEITKFYGHLSEKDAVGYILQVADALRYVHSKNRLHLDIKPGNIMVDKNGKAILIDFGASKHYDAESGDNTSTLLGLNTKGYAPIEQLNQSFTSFSPATDIYSLGATFYKLVTGITPPDASLLSGEEEILPPIPNSISLCTRTAISRAMAIKRKDRPQNIDQFLSILDSSNEELGDEETILDVGDSKKLPEAKFKWDWFVALLFTVCLAVLFLAYFQSKSKADSSQPITTDYVSDTSAEPEDVELVDTQTSTYKSNLPEYTYERFDNFRGWSVYVPSFMEPGEIPDNGSGQTFYMDKRTYIHASGMYTLDVTTLDDSYNDDLEWMAKNNWTIEYRPKKQSWYVMSGFTSDGRIYYKKTALLYSEGIEVIAKAELVFDREYKEDFDPIIKYVFSKFPNP